MRTCTMPSPDRAVMEAPIREGDGRVESVSRRPPGGAAAATGTPAYGSGVAVAALPAAQNTVLVFE